MNDAQLIGAVHSAMYRQCKERGYAAPVDVLMDIGVLPKNQYEAWRFGKVSYLESVCTVNLRKLSFIMHQMRLYAQIYEDAVLGNLSQERYQKMSQSYEEEQERLKLEIEVTEEWVDQQMELEDNLDAFLALTEKYVDVQELTPTIVNEFIKKILVYAPDKSSGKRKQRVRIFFNFLDEVEIPAVFEPIIYERPTKNRKTA